MYDKKIKELIAQMTFEEKIGQMTQCGTSIYTSEMKLNEDVAKDIRDGKIGSFLSICGIDAFNDMQKIAVEESRLGIPLFFAHDVIHGFRTIFPLPAGEACSFEPELAYESSKVMATETRANGIQVTWNPMMDISYDQRWGRGFEGAGEDTYLGCKFAEARVRGWQHADLKDDSTVAACAKHYVGYGACQGGRDYNTVEMSDDSLYNTYLPPFRAAVDAGVEMVMTAFHDFNGVPCTSNSRLNRDILRGELGFDGVIVSDFAALSETVSHGFASDGRDAADKALKAGLDIEMGTTCYRSLEKTPENIKLIDEAVYRILSLKFRLGLFDNPYADAGMAEKRTALSEHIALARNIAKRSVVLLENNGILPMKGGRLAVIGSLANDKRETIGGWCCTEVDKAAEMAVTVLDGMRSCGKFDSVSYADGYFCVKDNAELAANMISRNYELARTGKELMDNAVSAARDADVILFVAGESVAMNGEAKSRASLAIPKAQTEVLDELTRLGKPIVMLVIAGRPLLVGDVSDKVDALLFTYNLGTEAGNAVADVITGEYNPSAKLVYTIPTSDGQCPTMHYAYRNTGRPYRPGRFGYVTQYIDADTMPRYCFGYGKSYTEFSYSGMRVDKDSYTFGERIKLSVEVANVGKADGEETVQVYMRDIAGSYVRPMRQLVAFKKQMIEKGTSQTVEFELDTEKMGYYFEREYIMESGEFMLFVGSSADDVLACKISIK